MSANAAWNIVNFRLGLIEGLQRAGYEIVAIAPADAYAERLIERGIPFHPIAIDEMGTDLLRDLKLLAAYYRLLKRLKPAFFLGFTAKPNVYGSIAARLLGIQAINNVSGLGTAFIKRGWLTRIVSALYRFAFRRSATVFFQNPEDRDLFIAERLVRAGQAGLLPGSGIDLARFAPQPAAERLGGPFTFLLVARLLWDKGVGEYVEAARRLRRELPDARFQMLGFVDVANLSAVPRAELDRWIAEGLIEHLGHAEDVRPAIAAADCVVLPSYREGLPRTLLEAAAMAKPIIATDVPGCRHIAQDGVNGFLCAPRDAGSLADAMLRMARLPPARRAEMGAAARARVEREFDEELVVSRYLGAMGSAAPAKG